MIVTSASQQQPNLHQAQLLSVQASTPPRKKIKLEENTEKITAVGLPDAEDYRRNIMKHKLKRMRVIREEYNENQTELFFLHNGGNIMEYLSWKKKPPSAQFQNYMNEQKLDLDDEEKYLNENSAARLTTNVAMTNTTNCTTAATTMMTAFTTSSSAGSLTSVVTTVSTTASQSDEVSVAGGTPVAISTTLPASVAQLSQQGMISKIVC